MGINTNKPEVQSIGSESVPVQVTTDGRQLKQVKKFTHLGNIVSRDGSSKRDIQRRLGLAGGVMQSPKKIWSSKDINVTANVKVYENWCSAYYCITQ